MSDNYNHTIRELRPQYRDTRTNSASNDYHMQLSEIVVRVERKQVGTRTKWCHKLRFDVDPDADAVMLGRAEDVRGDGGINTTALRDNIVRAERAVAEWLLVHGLEQYQVNRYHAALEVADEVADTPGFDERNE
jgi:hypothetical protein